MDQEAFGILYERFFPQVWAYAVSRIGRQWGEDAVAETFAVAWRRRADIPADPLPWLLAVARNVIREAAGPRRGSGCSGRSCNAGCCRPTPAATRSPRAW